MRLPEEKIDEIRRAADIVDIVSDYVRLTPSGRSYKAISPFNPSEKTASFYVTPEKQIYKCFSTGKGGNVFTFVQEMEKLPFIDAVKLIAKKVGIDLSTYEKVTSIADKQSEDYELMAWVAKYFHRNLTSEEGRVGLNYFSGRGLLKETISSFGLGYSFGGWSGLVNEAEKDQKPIHLLKEFGLIAHSEKKDNHYDVFRARVMFPIFSTAGKVIAFGGRALSNDKDTPKYINSPESRLYHKSEVLYAFNFARDEIRKKDEAILVEGYMDVITLHQNGIKTAVASSGTSLTQEQVRLIGRLTKNILFVYDGDSAGIKAMMRGIDIILEEGLSPKVLSLPNNDDPDSYVQKVGGEEFLKYASAHKSSFLDFKINVLKASQGFANEEQTKNSIHDLLMTISKISDELSREVYLKSLSEKIDIGFNTLEKQLGKFLSPKSQRPLKGLSRKPQGYEINDNQKHTPNLNPPFNRSQEVISVVERTFLKSLLESTYHGAEVIEFVSEKRHLLQFKYEKTEKIIDFILSRFSGRESSLENKFDLSTEINYINDETLRNFVSELLIDESISDRWQPEAPSVYARRCLMSFLDATKKIISLGYDERLNENMQEIEAETDADKIGLLISERNTLVKQKKTAQEEFEDTIKSLIGLY